VLSQT